MTALGLWRVEAVFAVAVGLAVGSFLNVVISRLPADRSLWPRSACPRCGRAISAAENVPLLSFVGLRGRCRGCAAPIPLSYPVVEALGGVLGYLAWVRAVPVGMIDAPHVWVWAGLLTFLGSLVAGALIDLRHRILPDELTIYAVPAALLWVAGAHALGAGAFPVPTLTQAVLGAATFGVGLTAVALGSAWILGREGLGMGDVKWMALIAAFLGGFPGGFVVLLLASLLGSVVGLLQLLITRRRGYLPLGPFLALAAGAWALYGDVFLPALFPALSAEVRLGD